MKAWTRPAGKLARYEHMGWKLWPERRCWSFHSGSIASCGNWLGICRASWPSVMSWRPPARADTALGSGALGRSARSKSSETDATIATSEEHIRLPASDGRDRSLGPVGPTHEWDQRRIANICARRVGARLVGAAAGLEPSFGAVAAVGRSFAGPSLADRRSGRPAAGLPRLRDLAH